MKGFYGGSIRALSLSAAMKTVREGFLMHSFHINHFQVPRSKDPVFCHVDRCADTKSFSTRVVRIRQENNLFAVATISFSSPSGNKTVLRYHPQLPQGLKEPLDENFVDDLAHFRTKKYGRVQGQRLAIITGQWLFRLLSTTP